VLDAVVAERLVAGTRDAILQQDVLGVATLAVVVMHMTVARRILRRVRVKRRNLHVKTPSLPARASIRRGSHADLPQEAADPGHRCESTRSDAGAVVTYIHGVPCLARGVVRSITTSSPSTCPMLRRSGPDRVGPNVPTGRRNNSR
jgi:hypothetical protein